jgi:hypothetical protein
MKHLGLVPIYLLIVMGLFFAPAESELMAYQEVPSQATVGEPVMVTVMLTYNGINSTQAIVTPSLPAGVATDAGGQSMELYPGSLQPISYPIMAEQSGTYWIVSQIAYAEDGSWHNLRLEAPFTALGGASQEPQHIPGQTNPTLEPQHMPGEMNPEQGPPHMPGETDPEQEPQYMPEGTNPEGTSPESEPSGEQSTQ